MGKRILVTGGCGFLGSYVVDLLVDRGHDVLVVDNLSTCWLDEETGEGPNWKNGGAEYVFEDVSNFQRFLSSDIESVLHLARRHPLEPERGLFSVSWESYVTAAVRLLLYLLDVRAPVERFVVPAHVTVADTRGRPHPHAALDVALAAFLRYWHRPPNLGAYLVRLPLLYGDRLLPEVERPGELPVERAAAVLANIADGTNRHQKSSELYPYFEENSK